MVSNSCFQVKILPVNYGLSYVVFILKVYSRLRLQQDSGETSILSVNFTWDHALGMFPLLREGLKEGQEKSKAGGQCGRKC